MASPLSLVGDVDFINREFEIPNAKAVDVVNELAVLNVIKSFILVEHSTNEVDVQVFVDEEA